MLYRAPADDLQLKEIKMRQDVYGVYHQCLRLIDDIDLLSPKVARYHRMWSLHGMTVTIN